MDRADLAEARALAIDTFAGRFPFPDLKQPVAMHLLLKAYDVAKTIVRERPC